MRQCKIACNATNSAAIDQHGRLWVWGSGKFGLLGKGKDETHRKIVQVVPTHLPIPPKEDKTNNIIKSKDAWLELYRRPEPLSNKTNKQHVVKDIAMGPYHMGVIAVDEEIHKEIAKNSNIADLFQKINDYFNDEKIRERIKKDIPQAVIDSSEFKTRKSNKTLYDEKHIVECGLIQQIGREHYNTLPYVPVFEFIDMLHRMSVELPQCKIQTGQKLNQTVESLQCDLNDGQGQDMINIKLIRDYILGEQQNNAKVWLWGLSDE